MSHVELAAKLQELLASEPALEQQLERSANLEQAVEYIKAAAGHHGATLDVDELKDTLRAATETAAGELADEQLAGVEGGLLQGGYVRDVILGMLRQRPY